MNDGNQLRTTTTPLFIQITTTDRYDVNSGQMRKRPGAGLGLGTDSPGRRKSLEHHSTSRQLSNSTFAPRLHVLDRFDSTRLYRLANMTAIRSSPGVPGHRQASAYRDQPHPVSVPHADLCPQRGCRQVAILVLHARSQEGQEGHR